MLILGGGTVTVTIADADLVGSATLVTVTVEVPEIIGAVYKPPGAFALHVTDVSLAFVTVSIN